MTILVIDECMKERVKTEWDRITNPVMALIENCELCAANELNFVLHDALFVQAEQSSRYSLVIG